MVHARAGLIAVFVVGCTVAAGDGATFGATGMDASSSGAECIVIEGLNGSFCSPWCDEDLACPEPTAGEAFAQCQLGPDLEMPPVHCALLCDPGSDACPDGMTCVDTGMPIGVCLFVG